MLTSAPGNPLVEIQFASDGVPLLARILQSSGDPLIDEFLRSSLYRWRASGKPLTELKGEQTIEVELRIVLNPLRSALTQDQFSRGFARLTHRRRSAAPGLEAGVVCQVVGQRRDGHTTLGENFGIRVRGMVEDEAIAAAPVMNLSRRADTAFGAHSGCRVHLRHADRGHRRIVAFRTGNVDIDHAVHVQFVFQNSVDDAGDLTSPPVASPGLVGGVQAERRLWARPEWALSTAAATVPE